MRQLLQDFDLTQGVMGLNVVGLGDDFQGDLVGTIDFRYKTAG